MNSAPAQYHDGVLSEWPHEILVDWTIFRKYLDVITDLTLKGKKVWFWVQPDIFKYSYLEGGKTYLERNNIPIDLNLERFYLASYLLIQQNPLTFFGYHPGPLYDGNQGLYFYKDWNQDYGTPVSNWTIFPTDIYVREYTNGFAVVNPYAAGQGSGDGSRIFNFPDAAAYALWDPNGSAASTRVTVPPKTGQFYFRIYPLKAQYNATAPVSWNINETKSFDVTVTNTGTETWKKDGSTMVNLAVYVGPDDDWTKATPNQLLVALKSDLAPGASQTLTVNMFAPATAGNYVLRMRMVKQGVAWFEQIHKTNITVSTPPPSPSPSPSPLKPGDIDGNNKIDIFDYNILLSNFRKTGTNIPGDLDKNGKVDIFDYNILLTNFGK